MSRPPLALTVDHYTLSQVCRRLKMSRRAVKNRISAGIFRSPTKIVGEGNRLFNDTWMKHAEIMLLWEQKLISKESRDLALAELGV